MPNKVTLYPIYWVADAIDEQPFNHAALPVQIIEGVTIEDVSPMFNDETFTWVQNELGRHSLADLRTVRFAIVHRFQTRMLVEGEPDHESEVLVRKVAACLRLIRPMRQRALLMRGELREDGTIDVQHFEHPIDLMEVPEVQKLFDLRDCDVALLRAVANQFLRAMEGEFWKFRMAVQFYETGHFENSHWKTRYLLWCSAVEAIFTSRDYEHRGSLVAKERIKWFLGATARIYEPGDIPNFVEQPMIRVVDIADDMYRLRNLIAHGERVPDEYFQRMLRRGLNGDVNLATVLTEGLSFIVRKSLLRILQDNLLDNFTSGEEAGAYFGAAGLTRMEIRRRQRQTGGENDE